MVVVEEEHVHWLCNTCNTCTFVWVGMHAHLFLRPARPAICFTRLDDTGADNTRERLLSPSRRPRPAAAMAAGEPPEPRLPRVRLTIVVKMTRRMLKFNPRPTASLATRTLTPEFGSLNSRACSNSSSSGYHGSADSVGGQVQ